MAAYEIDEVLEPSQQEELVQIVITENEFNDIIAHLKQKAEGIDNIVNELIKYGGENLKQKLHKLIARIWEKEEMPKDWERGILIPIL